jgi:hypothetical protein
MEDAQDLFESDFDTCRFTKQGRNPMGIYFIAREKGDDIIKYQVEIISRIKKLNDEYCAIINDLTIANNLLRTVNTKSNSSQKPPQDISVRTDKIEGRFGKVQVSLQEEYVTNLSQGQQGIRDKIDEIEGSLNKINGEFDASVMGNTLFQLKAAPFGITGVITIVLILIVSVLTVFPFFFMQDQMEIVYTKGINDVHVNLEIIPILLTLTGIWYLVFMYIKSRLKSHEQDSTFLRKFLHDN